MLPCTKFRVRSLISPALAAKLVNVPNVMSPTTARDAFMSGIVARPLRETVEFRDYSAFSSTLQSSLQPCDRHSSQALC
jgi:hypothetical protein